MSQMELDAESNNPDTEIKDEGGTDLFAGYSSMEELTAVSHTEIKNNF